MGGVYAERFNHMFYNTDNVVCNPVIPCHGLVDCGTNKECHELPNAAGLPEAFCLCREGFSDGVDENDQARVQKCCREFLI